MAKIVRVNLQRTLVETVNVEVVVPDTATDRDAQDVALLVARGNNELKWEHTVVAEIKPIWAGAVR